MLPRWWWGLVQDFYRGLTKSCCLMGLVASVQQWDAPQSLVWTVVPLQHRPTRDPDFRICCMVYFEFIGFKNWDVPFLHRPIEAVQVVLYPTDGVSLFCFATHIERQLDKVVSRG